MKINKMMRIASVLLVAVLLSTCAIFSTFAKYVTTTSSQDQARVAVWGINKDAVTMNLFDSAYSTDVKANDGDNLIAPGTTMTSQFSIVNASATLPEVKYTLKIDLAGSDIAESIKNNTSIVWQLDGGAELTWDELMTAILKLSGNNTVAYEKGVTESVTVTCDYGTVPAAFVNGATHSITWTWKFDGNDVGDTAMGNAAVSGDLNVQLVVAITATQVNE